MSYKLTSKTFISAILSLIAVMLFYGCTKPKDDYKYIGFNPLKGWEKSTPIIFNLDLVDTINVCEIYFAAKIKNNQDLNHINGFPIEVCFKSPKGNTYYSNVSLPINVTQQQGIYKSSRGIIEIEWPFLKNIKNKEGGIWQITINQTDMTNIYRNIIGFGICFKESK